MDQKRIGQKDIQETAQPEIWEEEIESTPQALGMAVEKFGKLIKEHGWDDSSDLLKLGFDEAMQNKMGHGNKAFGTDDFGGRIMHSDNAHRKVYVRVEVSPTSIKAALTDEGEGFDHDAQSSKKKKQLEETDEDALVATGRGLLFTSLSYDIKHSNEGRTVLLSHPKVETETK